ncbi:NrfD/PsrC family molybdoenzyme membrane anchor subunit [Actinopolyspora mortivallis]|uniref:Polysulfide reductase n=1 Tax=Actinopolyspora mortivallis TaxID=33906 RepID=A0A2T0GRL8_ACTMO|nr:NrfD/PsrC family molybdoenzyme membrane anchor subunit [Actinopolyspora mortivallis]PRW61756.1 polysulfide reductase [Actinopolyspora mortivallis]
MSSGDVEATRRPVEDRPPFRSYYGRPVIKEPTWKVPDVPAYLYLGGTAGASAVMAAAAGARGQTRLRRVGRLCAAGGSAASVLALVHDLGRPARFLNMLRVFKPTSPLSVGSWILAPFSAVTTAVAASEVTGIAPFLAGPASAVSAVLGTGMTTYTAVLLADTAVPGWHEVHRELPFVFASSAVLGAGALATASTPPEQSRPARRMTVLGAAGELASGLLMERRAGRISEAYRTGRPGTVLRAARALAVVAAGAALRAGRGGTAAWLAGVCGTAAAAATRYGVFEAGRVTARDPYYTVVPQRERARRDGRSEG